MVDGPSGVRLSFDRGTLLVRGEPAKRLPESLGSLLEWDARVAAYRCHAIHYATLRRRLRSELGPAFVDDLPSSRLALPREGVPRLRPDQWQALTAWERRGRSGQVVMPTGTGKTQVALTAIARARRTTLVVAPIRDLMHQWRRRLGSAFQQEVGVLGDGMAELRPLTVTTYRSAYLHMPEIGDRFGMVVFDEAHHLPSPARQDAALLCAAPTRLGLTATPQRPDGLEWQLASLVGPVVYRQPMHHAAGRTLADYHVVRVPVDLNSAERRRYTAAKRVIRRYAASRSSGGRKISLANLPAAAHSDPEARRALRARTTAKAIEAGAAAKRRVLEDLLRLHASDRSIVFTGSNDVAIGISRRFLIPALLTHTPTHERRAVLDGFDRGKFPALVTNQVLDEGVDVPSATVAIVLGGLSSVRQAKQRLGRILRRSESATATLYEVVCDRTGEVDRSRKRRRSDAYPRPRHRRI